MKKIPFRGHLPPKTKTLKKSNRYLTQSRLRIKGCTTAERYCLLHVVVQGPRSFRRLVNFSIRRTVAELQNVKIAKFLDFCLSSPYTTPKKYLLVTSLQPRGYIAEWFRFFHVIVEGPKECVPQQSFHATSGSGAGDSQTCRNFCLWQMAIPIQNTTTWPIRSGRKMWQSLRQETVS